MKAKIKSIILVLLMAVSISGIVLTVNDAAGNKNNPMMNMSEPSSGGLMENAEENQSVPPSMPDYSAQPEKSNQGEMPDNDFRKGNMRLNVIHIALIGVFSVVFSTSFMYLLMSIKNKQFFKNRDKVIIFILSSALLASYLTAGVSAGANYFLPSGGGFEETQAERDKADLDKSNTVGSQKIDLSSQNTDVTITKGGSYEFSGEFKKSILVDAGSEAVEIILNNVKISNESTAAIIGLSAKSLTINLSDGSENILSDGGNSEYDGCIFSNCELIFTGNGKLTVNGNQNEGEGIATEAADITINSGTLIVISNDDGINAGGDGAEITINGGDIFVNASGDGIDSNKNAVINGGTLFVIGSDVGGDAGIDTDMGYTINGGTVVALGSDMIEIPLNTSRQNTAAFTLGNKIDKDALVSLRKGNETIVSFAAPKSFRTMIISSDKIVNGDYKLFYEALDKADSYGIYTDDTYTDKNALSINNQDTFSVSTAVNLFGNK